MHVGADAEIFGLEICAGTAAGAASEGFLENILEAAKTAASPAGAAAPGGTGETLWAEIKAFEIGVGTEAAGTRPRAAAAESFKPLEARLALGIDLAAVECLAFVRVAKKLMRRVQFGKARCRFGIVLIGVGMQFFCKLAIGAFDVACACFAIDAQDLVGIAHPRRAPLKCRGLPRLPTLPECGIKTLVTQCNARIG